MVSICDFREFLELTHIHLVVQTKYYLHTYVLVNNASWYKKSVHVIEIYANEYKRFVTYGKRLYVHECTLVWKD